MNAKKSKKTKRGPSFSLLLLLFLCGALAPVASAAPLQVTVTPAGAGTLSLSQYASDQVMLTATPSEGYVFSGFSGGSAGADGQQSLALTAVFTPLQNAGSPGTLAVTPGSLAASGAVGGRFAPTAFAYTLRNTGGSTLQWAASATVPWLGLSSAGGSLAPGAVTTLTVSLSGAAGALGTGYYTDALRFSNLTNASGDTTRPASLIVTDRPGEISVVTTGDSFSPVLTVDSGAAVAWHWADGSNSSSPAPEKAFGSAALRVNTFTVTPWSALKRINLGYDASDGGSPVLEQVPGQQVVAVAGLENAAPYLKKWCSSHTSIASLNFDNFVNLDTIESFHAGSLAQVSLHNTSQLSRANFEGCGLAALDLTESPALTDLRGGFNSYPGIDFGASGSKAWHICTAYNEQFSQNLPVAQFQHLRELFVWHGNQTGALKTTSTSLTAVIVHHNAYTSADFSGGFVIPNGWLEINDNQLSSLNLGGCSGLTYVDASNNLMQSDAIDSVLATLDSLGGYGDTIDLTGNFPPSAVGLQHAEALRQRGWTVKLADQKSARRPPEGLRLAAVNPGARGEASLTRTEGAFPYASQGAFAELDQAGGYGWALDYRALMIR